MTTKGNTVANQLHYPGDQTAYDPTHYVGPDRFGAFYRPIGAAFDGQRTTIEYQPIAPADLPEFADDKVRQMEDADQIMQLFGRRW